MDALSQRCASKRPVHLCLVTPRNLEERPGGTDPGGLLERGVGFAGEGRMRVGAVRRWNPRGTREVEPTSRSYA